MLRQQIEARHDQERGGPNQAGTHDRRRPPRGHEIPGSPRREPYGGEGGPEPDGTGQGGARSSICGQTARPGGSVSVRQEVYRM